MAQIQIPNICYEQFNYVKNFVNDIISKYKSLSNWGKPVFTNELQVACVIWCNERLNLGLQQVANMLGIDKTTLYKLTKRIDEQGQFNIFDVNTKTIVTIKKSKYDLLQLVDQELQPKAKVIIGDILESSIIREFLTKDVEKRAKILGHKPYISERQKKETLRVISRLIEYFKSREMATNPDVWTEQDVEKALYDIYGNDFKKIRRAMKCIRRVPAWRSWFEGKVGAETKFITPIQRYITYEQYLQIKRMWKDGKISEAEFLILWLHLTTGAREGWESTSLRGGSLEDANTSLIGLKWDKLYQVHNTWILEVFESKTSKTWMCDLSWLDPEPINVLAKYRRNGGSIVASVTGIESVAEFRKWYSNTLKKISNLLGLGFTLVPHDMRRSHISILAELGVPLEIAVSGHMDFGVGWEDLKTAVVFYLRFSRYVKQRIMEEIEMRKKELEKNLST